MDLWGHHTNISYVDLFISSEKHLILCLESCPDLLPSAVSGFSPMVGPCFGRSTWNERHPDESAVELCGDGLQGSKWSSGYPCKMRNK